MPEPEMMSYFKLQLLAQQIQTSLMKQVADIILSKLGYCPAFLISQEPIHDDTKLKVVISFTMDNHSKPEDFHCAGNLSKLENSTIYATSPTISTFPCSSHCGNHSGILFSSGLIFRSLSAFLFCQFFMRVLNVGL